MTSLCMKATSEEVLDRPKVRHKESSAYNPHSNQLAEGAAKPSYATVTSRRSSHAIKPGLAMFDPGKDKLEEVKCVIPDWSYAAVISRRSSHQ